MPINWPARALSGANADFIEELYARYLEDPRSIDPSWARYFAGLKAGGAPEAPIRRLPDRSLASAPAAAARPVSTDRRPAPADTGAASAKQGAVSRLIQVYANRGHLIAQLDPLGLAPREKPYVLDPAYFGLSEADMDTEFFTGSRTPAIPARSKLKDILAALQFIYCDTIGAEFAHVSDTEERLWLQDQFQSERLQHRFPPRRRRTSSGSSRPPRAWSATCTRSTWARSASRSRAAIV